MYIRRTMERNGTCRAGGSVAKDQGRRCLATARSGPGPASGTWHVARGEWRVASGTGGSVVMVVPWESKEANTNTRHVTRFPISSFKIGPLLGFQQTIPVFTYLATIPV
jgi:hypothetical protein